MSNNLSGAFGFVPEDAASELECLPYGVHHADEGVCLLVRMGPHRIMLDCGLADMTPLWAGVKKSALPGGSPLPADLVLVSHAHADHARGLLALHERMPLLPIYASEVTSKLVGLNWLSPQGEEMSQFCHGLPLRSPVELQAGLTVELFPAGHLPGAVVYVVTYTTDKRSYKLLYTGDFFLSNSRLVEGLPLEELRGLEPDVLIIEGSYGTARHPHRRQQENQLAERINRAIADGCSVLLPTPTLGLGQELLMLLRSHHHFTGRDLDIWVDGTVATGCDTYLELLSYLPSAVQNFARHQPLFWDERVRPRVRRLQPEQRRSIGQSPCIVLTDELADLNEYCHPDAGRWVVFLPETPGRALNIDTEVQTTTQGLPNTDSAIVARVESYLLAQHSDGPGVTQLIHNLRPQHVVFVHGSPTYLADLTSLEELQNRYHIHSPAAGTVVDLPVGDTFLQPAAPETHYDGEVTELGGAVTIMLPDSITKDPRWRQFADTGLIELRWQGEELVVRGLSPRELLNQNSDRFTWTDVDCCGTCRHQRGQRCWNPASPLFNFKVTLEGYCPAFERNSDKSAE